MQQLQVAGRTYATDCDTSMVHIRIVDTTSIEVGSGLRVLPVGSGLAMAVLRNTGAMDYL